jgi:hypothetical protein
MAIVFNQKQMLSRELGFWNWDHIQKAVSGVTVTLPDKWRNPATQRVYWRDQAGQGYCVGFSCANCDDILYNMLHPEDAPTAADIAGIKRNIPIVLGPDNTSYDIGPRQAGSGACAYHRSREYDPTIGPAGSYIDLVMKAWHEKGICRDWQWYTSKSGRSEWVLPYPDKDPETGETAQQTAEKHKIGGYAQVIDIESMKRAMYGTNGTNGCGCIECAIMVYENYMDGQSDGEFPMPRGQDIGGHALCICGWDETGFIIMHTWQGEGWPQFGKISYNYWKTAGIGAFTPLSPSLAKYAQANVYVKLVINTNLESDIYLGGNLAGTTAGNTLGLQLLQNTQYTIVAKCKSTGESQQKVVDMLSTTVTISFQFSETPTPPTPPKPGNGISAKIAEALRKLREKFKKIFGW